MTVLTEVKATVNFRPLTYIYSRIDEQSLLTLPHVLFGRTLTELPEPNKNFKKASVAARTSSLLLRKVHYVPVDDVALIATARRLKYFWQLGRAV